MVTTLTNHAVPIALKQPIPRGCNSLADCNPQYQALFQRAKTNSSALAQANLDAPSQGSWRNPNFKNLATAVGLFGAGLFLRRLPSIEQTTRGLPKDWKVYAKVLLGIFSVSQFNKAFDLKPPAWAQGLQTVGVIHPLTMGFSASALPHLALMMPLVAGVVETANRLQDTVGEAIHDKTGVPKMVLRLILSFGLAGLGMKVYPKLFETLARRNLLGKTAKETAQKGGAAVAGSAMVTCARGCTPGGVICMSELGELLGSMGGGLGSQLDTNNLKPKK